MKRFILLFSIPMFYLITLLTHVTFATNTELAIGDGLDSNCKSTDQVVSLTAVNPNADSLFFEAGSSWKYLDDGTDQGTAWQQLSFDDSDWQIGQGHMGFGESDQDTELTSGFITYYFRKVVDIPDLSLIDEIYFNIVHDDGAVVHVNGVEVLRSALMPAGDINYLTGTTTFIPNDVENDFWSYAVDKDFFIEGENIIAIEIHNQRVGSSDISFDCFVNDEFNPGFKLDGPYVFYRDGKVHVKSVNATGPVHAIYDSPQEANLVCYFPEGIDSFMVELQPSLVIEESDYALPQKFLAISDIEGNLGGFIMALQDAGVIDQEYNWSFGDGHFIFNGDMFDRGNNVTECLWLIYRLEQQAMSVGGKVHFVIGNHEILNLNFDFRYVAQKYINNVQLMDETLESVYASDSELGRWLRTKNVIERIDPFVFVHAGLSPELSALNLTYDEINMWGRFGMDSVCQTTACEIVNGGSDFGIYWYRGMADEDLTQTEVDDIIPNFDGELVVIGHSVFDSITLLYNDKVICIDLDHKDNFAAGFMSAFYYENGQMFDYKTDGVNQTYKLLGGISSVDDMAFNQSLFNMVVSPNPAHEVTTIEYSIPSISRLDHHSAKTGLSVIDANGKEVKKILLENQSVGRHSVELDATDLGAGVYFIRLTLGEFEHVEKLVVVE